MQAQEKVFSTTWLGRELTIKTGKLAKQATAAVTVQYGETVVLATVVKSSEAREGLDFFPLMVEFEERLYAVGVIKGSKWIKREGRPSDDAVLVGRMIDRSIRPLFDQSSRQDVQVVVTVLSVDQENDFDVVSLVAASVVLGISGIEWYGPIGGIRVGRVNNEFVLNPTYEQQALSDLDLVVAGTAEKVLMIEAGAKEIPEVVMNQAIKLGQANLQPVIDLIKKAQAELGRPTFDPKNYPAASIDKLVATEVAQLAKAWLNDNIKHILFQEIHYTKGERKAAVKAIKAGLATHLTEKGIEEQPKDLSVLVEAMIEAEITRAILEEKRRVDGRALNQIRHLASEVGILPRNHGAGLFDRGETQVMSIVTLGAPGDAQSMEGMEGASEKRYMHHYNFPGYCVGEAKPNRGTGRREIGHGALAEKALIPVLPSKEEFAYTIRVVSETLGSNGSSSMGSTCASTLALMDAGVPIKKPVAGIAMGLASNPDMSRWEVLTDLQDLEDGEGGMDFKVTGTVDGITAIQLDTKTMGLTDEIVELTLNRAYEARLQILDVMKAAISEPRAELSKYAPRLISFRIDPEKIREVIGSGGKVINEIIAACEVTIDIEDDGLVMICGHDAAKTEQAIAWVKNIVKEFEAGEIVMGKVVRMMDFGAFVEVGPKKDGLVHVSEMAPYRVGKPSDLLKIGDEVKVKIKEIDDQGRVNLTMKEFTENGKYWIGEKGKMDPNAVPERSPRPNFRRN